ncbi:unnamed protein product [Leuciscus chuanchicus]
MQLNSSIFSTLNIKHAVSSAYRLQCLPSPDQRTEMILKLLTQKMTSTPVNKMKLLNETVLRNIEHARGMQQNAFQNRKRKFVRVCSVQAGDDVLLSGDPKKRRTGDTFTSQHKGPFTVASISSKGVATIAKWSTCQRVNVSRLRTYYRLKNGPTERMILQDHCYSIFEWQIEHPYACSGAEWEKDLGPIQDELPIIVRDLLAARDWVRSHGDLFCRKCLDDMETFLSSCADEQGLKVNAMFVCS